MNKLREIWKSISPYFYIFDTIRIEAVSNTVSYAAVSPNCASRNRRQFKTVQIP